MENTRACKRDNNTVYIAGNETGHLIIVKSTDRGITWQNPIEHSSLANYQVRALGCIPRAEGDILLLQGFRAGYEVAIFRSENGGVSWERVLSYPTGSTSYPHRYFYKLATVNRIISSIMIDGDLRILTSEDWGKTWTLRFSIGHPSELINQMSIIEGDNNVVLADIYGSSSAANIPSSYRIARSNDGGITWQGVSFNSLGSYMGNFQFVSNGRLANGILFVLGYFTASPYHLFLSYSTDNGQSFKTRTISNIYPLSSIATQDVLIFSTTDNKIYRFPYSDWGSGNPSQVSTTTYPIYDFVGFEAT